MHAACVRNIQDDDAGNSGRTGRASLRQLIDRLCPDGVPFVKLGDYINIYTGDQFNKRDMSTSGSYPVVNGGINPSGFIESYNEPQDTITISQGGASAGFVAWQATPFWAGAHCYVIKPNSKLIINRFLYFFLKNKESYLQQMQHGAGIPALNRDKVKELKFPLIPIEVQEEIVRILNTFSAYAASLQAELQARKEQYEYYRNLLLTFNPSACGCGTDGEQEIKVTTCGGGNYKIIWKTMGEIGKFIRGKRFVRTDIVEHGIPCIHYGDMYTHYGLYASETPGYINEEIAKKMRFAEKNDVVIVAAGENKEDLGNALAWLGDEPAAVHDACFIFRSEMYPNYLSHICRTRNYHRQVRMFANEAKICSVSGADLSKVVIPLPPYELQVKIASILDHFEALVNDLTQGLPAEIAAVRERYEYYRNKLLTFKKRA